MRNFALRKAEEKKNAFSKKKYRFCVYKTQYTHKVKHTHTHRQTHIHTYKEMGKALVASGGLLLPHGLTTNFLFCFSFAESLKSNTRSHTSQKIKRIKRKRSRSCKGQPVFLYKSLREEECIEQILRTMICGDRSPLPGGPIRLNSIKGYGNRTNNIIYCSPLLKSPKDEVASVVVYFGGDVQDVPENMEGNRDTKIYVKFNLENTATLLREAFPKAHIIVILPSRMEYTTFSCFDNFVRGNCAGIPDHTPMHYALQHLEELLSNISKKLTKIMSESELLSKLTAARSQVPPAANSSNDTIQEMDVDILQVQDGGGISNSDHHDEDASFHDCRSSSANNDQIMVVETNTTATTTTNPTAANNQVLSSPIVQSVVLQQNAAVATTTNFGITTTTTPSTPGEILWWRDSLNLDKANIALVGFSKGCVVLNQV